MKKLPGSLDFNFWWLGIKEIVWFLPSIYEIYFCWTTITQNWSYIITHIYDDIIPAVDGSYNLQYLDFILSNIFRAI